MRGLVPVLLTAAGAAGVAAAGILTGAGPAAAAPLSATLALVLANPALPSARPVAVLGGHTVAVLGGLLAALLVPQVPMSVPVAVGVAAAVGLGGMLLLRVLHPPAVATGCVLVLQPLSSALVLIGAAGVVAAALTLRERLAVTAPTAR